MWLLFTIKSKIRAEKYSFKAEVLKFCCLPRTLWQKFPLFHGISVDSKVGKNFWPAIWGQNMNLFFLKFSTLHRAAGLECINVMFGLPSFSFH